jgi:hypothetical protein
MTELAWEKTNMAVKGALIGVPGVTPPLTAMQDARARETTANCPAGHGRHDMPPSANIGAELPAKRNYASRPGA